MTDGVDKSNPTSTVFAVNGERVLLTVASRSDEFSGRRRKHVDSRVLGFFPRRVGGLLVLGPRSQIGSRAYSFGVCATDARPDLVGCLWSRLSRDAHD